MVEKLEHAQLQKITIHNKSVQWYQKDKEIIINSTLFDVHSYSVTKDSTVFTGLFDIKETELKAQVKKLLDQSDKSDDSRDLVIAKLIMQLWIMNYNSRESQLLRSLSIDKKYAVSFVNTISSDISIPSPPPRA